MRTLNSAGQALRARALAGEKIPIIPLVYFGLTVPQRWALCGMALSWGGNTWEALDIAISDVQDDANEFGGLRFTFPGVTPSERALATSDDVEGAEVTVYLAYVDPLTGVVADAMQVWAGELDQPGWQGGKVALVHFTAEHRATIAMRQRVIRYTNDEQQRLFPGDTSLNVDPLTDAAPIVWPAASYFKA